jgi:hypothetical protein
MKDALRLATKDQDFAAMLVTKPEELQAHFNLNEKEVTHLKELGRAALSTVKVVGPQAAD